MSVLFNKEREIKQNTGTASWLIMVLYNGRSCLPTHNVASVTGIIAINTNDNVLKLFIILNTKIREDIFDSLRSLVKLT
jgi:hypothetical protein